MPRVPSLRIEADDPTRPAAVAATEDGEMRVALASVPLPSGAATEATLATLATAAVQADHTALLTSILAALSALVIPGARSSWTWGAGSIAATTVPRWLFPGWSTGTADTNAVGFLAPFSGVLESIYVRHRSGAGNGGAIVYAVWIAGVLAGSVSLASTGTSASTTGLAVAIAAGALIELRVTKAASIGASPMDIAVSAGLRAA